jgi:hypothetical protein
MRRELMAFAEQALQIFLGDVTVAGGDIHHQSRGAIGKSRKFAPRTRPAPPDGIANQSFHDLPI